MIHEFKNGHWVPGDAGRDGGQHYPAQPRPGGFFNDVTGAAGATAAEVAEPLSALLMKQAAMADLLPRPVDWAGFMARLQLAGSKTQVVDREFGRVWVKPDHSLVVSPSAGWSAAIVQEAAGIAWALVRANGQMDFIRQQPWFAAGTHRLVLVLEHQFDRSTPGLVFHQDTAGCALFSNLMFRNTPGLPAPEWSVNLEPMPPGKRELVGRLWPPALLAAIDEERRRLAASTTAWRIEGGVLPADACVSWTDELVWHSTPWLDARLVYTRELAFQLLGDEAFHELTYDLLTQVVQTPGSRLAVHLAQQGIAVAALSVPKAQALWETWHADPAAAPCLAALRQDVDAIEWSTRQAGTASAMSLIRDMPDGTQHITTQPSGLVGRPRSNSENLTAIKADTRSFQPRHFMQVLVNVQPAH